MTTASKVLNTIRLPASRSSIGKRSRCPGGSPPGGTGGPAGGGGAPRPPRAAGPPRPPVHRGSSRSFRTRLRGPRHHGRAVQEAVVPRAVTGGASVHRGVVVPDHQVA